MLLWKKEKKQKVKRDYKEIEYIQIDKNEFDIIDVRTKLEYMEYHLTGSRNIPLDKLKENIEKIIPNKEEKILLYCQSGNRSKKAIKILEKLGYKNLYNLKGGLENI